MSYPKPRDSGISEMFNYKETHSDKIVQRCEKSMRTVTEPADAERIFFSSFKIL